MQPINTIETNEISSITFNLNKDQDVDLLLGPKISFLNQLKEMEDTPTKEQLNHLLLLCNLKTNTEQVHLNKILFFAFAKAKEGLGVTILRPLMGELIYLVNQNINEIIALLNDYQEEEQAAKIHEAFEHKLNTINNTLLKLKDEHTQGMLQDAEKALSVRIPIELAKALISDAGFINIGIIEPLKQRFLSKKKMPFEKSIAFALNAIRMSLPLRQKIHLIQSSFSQTMPGNDIVRITLGLSEKVTSVIDAKKTALAALISHMRQSPASSCFASFLAIELLSKAPLCCLNDFCELLQKSHISRDVDGQLKEFSFLMRGGNESTSKKIQLDKRGKIYSEKGLSCYLWEVPGIKAACKAIGIKNKKEFLADLSDKLVENSKIKLELSVSKLLKHIAMDAVGDSNYNFYCAKLGYESQLHNPLLRVWENAIASMAEANEHGKLTEALIQSVIKSLSKMFGTNSTTKQELKNNFRQYILKYAHFAYDIDIKNNQISNDGRSDRGAFILYDKNGSISRKSWKRIENENDFRSFVTEIARRSFYSIKGKDELLNPIKEHIKKDKFLADCLRFYDSNNLNKSDEELIKKLNSLAHTPWKDKTGNNSTEVLRVYSGTTVQNPPFILTPKSAHKLLQYVIEMGKKIPEKTKRNLNSNPGHLSPLIIRGMHALSMIFGHESFKGIFNMEKTASEWINENLIVPGKKVSESKITSDMQKKLCFFISNNAIAKDDKVGATQFKDKCLTIPADITLSVFRNTLITIMKEIRNENSYPIKTITLGIDSYIFKHIISKESQELLKKSAIHFADTNWSHGLHDIHFCFIFSPASGLLEIWEVYEDGSGLYPMIQADWLTKSWEIYNP